MKEILVAIDFSKSSLHALNYAINIANAAGANVHMIWVDNTRSEESLFGEPKYDMRKDQKENFVALVENVGGNLKKGKLSYSIKKGKVHHEVATLANHMKSDLIIAGTHGVTGFEEYWIGSNAYRIVTYAPCPVITLRSEFELTGVIPSIVFPVDNTIETKQKLPFTCSLARLYNAEIRILVLYSSPIKVLQKKVDGYAAQVEQYLKQENVSYTVDRKEPDNVTRAVLDFAVESNAGLIAIMTEQSSTKANLFLGPHAEELISHSRIPILSLRSKDLIND